MFVGSKRYSGIYDVLYQRLGPSVSLEQLQDQVRFMRFSDELTAVFDHVGWPWEQHGPKADLLRITYFRVHLALIFMQEGTSDFES